jgi:hypothetical protein
VPSRLSGRYNGAYQLPWRGRRFRSRGVSKLIFPGILSDESGGGGALEIMIGIAVLLVGAGVGWLCFAVGVYFLTRTGREGMRIARMAEERRPQPSAEK